MSTAIGNYERAYRNFKNKNRQFHRVHTERRTVSSVGPSRSSIRLRREAVPNARRNAQNAFLRYKESIKNLKRTLHPLIGISNDTINGWQPTNNVVDEVNSYIRERINMYRTFQGRSLARAIERAHNARKQRQVTSAYLGMTRNKNSNNKNKPRLTKNEARAITAMAFNSSANRTEILRRLLSPRR